MTCVGQQRGACGGPRSRLVLRVSAGVRKQWSRDPLVTDCQIVLLRVRAERPGRLFTIFRIRLIISGYQAVRPRWIERTAFDWPYVLVVWPMQARMMPVLKGNIERGTRARTQAVALVRTVSFGSQMKPS